MDRPEHHSIDRMKEFGMEKESGRHSTLRSRKRSMINQTNFGAVSREKLDETAKRRGGARMGLSELYDGIWSRN